MKSKIIVTLITLMFCMSIVSVTAFAQAPPNPDATQAQDTSSAANNTANENQSSIPTYPNANEQDGSNQGASNAPTTEPPIIEAVPSPSNPFTPPGTGTVVDNATSGDGKEFFTIQTEDGNVFFLIIDRQRGVDNVYFLNAVTVEDLLSLAQPSSPGDDSGTISAIPPIEPPEPEVPDLPEMPEEAEIEEAAGGNSRLILILVVVAGVGGAAYYFKIVKGKRDDSDDDDPYDDEDDGYDDDDSEDEDIEDGYDYEPEDDDGD